MNARVVEATVNGVSVWRIYYKQELIATFTSESTALSFANYLENKDNDNKNQTQTDGD